MPLITDPDLLTDKATDDNTTEVFIKTSDKTIKLTVVGNLSSDGVTLKALYSFLKEEWRNDPFAKNLAAFPFPMVPITDEQFEFVDGWDLLNDTGRYLIRSAGWTVRNTSGNVTQKWAGVQGLGSIQGNDDQLYFQQVSGGAATNFQLTGQVNQAIQILKDDNGNGNFAEGADFDRRSYLQLFSREYNQLYGKAALSDIGETALDGKLYKFPISSQNDTKITDNDTNVGANSPYTAIKLRYLSSAYNREVDSGTARNFGIVVDVGTYSQSNGVTNGTTLLTSANIGDITLGDYTGGSLIVHEGAGKGTYTISGTPVNNSGTLEVTTTAAITGSASSISFTLQRATPVSATAEEIYTKVQYLLRQNSDIDGTSGTVTGKTADSLMNFVGDTLISGRAASGVQPTNPNGGGSGVIIEGFDANDTNRLTFYDSSNTSRTYPFVATLTINFGTNLQNDASAKYWVYFTTLPGASNDYGESGAVLIDDNDGNDMAGNVSAAASVTLTFDYDNNVQGGRTAGTDADYTVVGIGLATGQYVVASGTIGRSTSNSASLVAPLERNYANP